MQISVVMPAYNAEKHIAEAMDSVLKQSFTDFEFIIIDDGSTDDTLKVISSFNDKRIVLIENEHNFIRSLNKGMQAATGKYIACMDAGDMMHIDRLKIQFNILEEEPSITVCGTWMKLFGAKIPKGEIVKSLSGIIDNPLLVLLNGNVLSHSTTMLRTQFLKTHDLQYENYSCTEDFKLWTEIAKQNGVFYLESQPLHLKRIDERTEKLGSINAQKENYGVVKNEIIHHLMRQSSEQILLESLLENLNQLHQANCINNEEIANFFYSLFLKKTLIRG